MNRSARFEEEWIKPPKIGPFPCVHNRPDGEDFSLATLRAMAKMIPYRLDILLLLDRKGGIRVHSFGSLKVWRHARKAEEASGGISRVGPDDDRRDEVRRVVRSPDETGLSLAHSPQDLSDAMGPSPRDSMSSHEIAIFHGPASPCKRPDFFCQILQVEVVTAAT